MKEEDEIKRLCGTNNPFTVPPDYFNQFAAQLMENLPPRKAVQPPVLLRPTRWQRIKPWLYMAAMFCGIAVGIGQLVRYAAPSTTGQEISDNETKVLTTDDYLDTMLENSLMGDYAIYCCLTDAEADY